MIYIKNMKAILSDFGRVLNCPRTCHWLIPSNFHEHVNKDIFESLDKNLVE